jgi:hypothetical protein
MRAVFGAKFVGDARTKSLSQSRGCPRTGPPRREARSAKFALLTYFSPKCVDHWDDAPSLGVRVQAVAAWRTPSLRKEAQILRICFCRGAT